MPPVLTLICFGYPSLQNDASGSASQLPHLLIYLLCLPHFTTPRKFSFVVPGCPEPRCLWSFYTPIGCSRKFSLIHSKIKQATRRR